MKTMRDYHDLYLMSDVMLLEDVFENFRSVCKKNYSLDPSFYYTAPGLSWDAMLKMTKVEFRVINRHRHVTDGREGNSWWGFYDNQEICRG